MRASGASEPLCRARKKRSELPSELFGFGLMVSGRRPAGREDERGGGEDDEDEDDEDEEGAADDGGAAGGDVGGDDCSALSPSEDEEDLEEAEYDDHSPEALKREAQEPRHREGEEEEEEEDDDEEDEDEYENLSAGARDAVLAKLFVSPARANATRDALGEKRVPHRLKHQRSTIVDTGARSSAASSVAACADAASGETELCACRTSCPRKKTRGDFFKPRFF